METSARWCIFAYSIWSIFRGGKTNLLRGRWLKILFSLLPRRGLLGNSSPQARPKHLSRRKEERSGAVARC
jgi:hypothetical protein